MPARSEGLGDEAIGREKALSVPRRFKPLHALLALTGGLVEVLRTIIEIVMLAMCDSRENLALGRSRTLQLVGNNHARYVA